MTKLVKVSGLKLEVALDRWMQFTKKTNHEEFILFLGMTRINRSEENGYYAWAADMWGVTPEADIKVAALFSPHWYAWLKAYEARNEGNTERTVGCSQPLSPTPHEV